MRIRITSAELCVRRRSFAQGSIVSLPQHLAQEIVDAGHATKAAKVKPKPKAKPPKVKPTPPE